MTPESPCRGERGSRGSQGGGHRRQERRAELQEERRSREVERVESVRREEKEARSQVMLTMWLRPLVTRCSRQKLLAAMNWQEVKREKWALCSDQEDEYATATTQLLEQQRDRLRKKEEGGKESWPGSLQISWR